MGTGIATQVQILTEHGWENVHDDIFTGTMRKHIIPSQNRTTAFSPSLQMSETMPAFRYSVSREDCQLWKRLLRKSKASGSLTEQQSGRTMKITLRLPGIWSASYLSSIMMLSSKTEEMTQIAITLTPQGAASV